MHKDKLPKALNDVSLPFVALSVGVPGSGKSTVLRELSEITGITRINPDEIRAEMTGSEIDQTKNKEVWEETYRRVQKALAKGASVLVDATHAEAFRRPETVKMYREFGAKSVVAVQFNTSLEEAKKRNQGRERVVPDYVLDKMHANIAQNPPSKDEGFDEIIEIDE